MNLPKDDGNYHWTSHAKGKMAHYRLSASLIKRIISNPKRKEVGIAPETIAVMSPKNGGKKPMEIWVMYSKRQIASANWQSKWQRAHTIIISAWIYPGASPVGKAIIIPDDIMLELEKWFNK